MYTKNILVLVESGPKPQPLDYLCVNAFAVSLHNNVCPVCRFSKYFVMILHLQG